MTNEKKIRYKGIAMVIVGLLSCIVGFYIGNKLIPDKIMEKVKVKLCIDSKENENYKNWVGSLDSFKNDVQMKITFWNLTNKEGFLYRGENPILKEVGPYIYLMSTMKEDVIFSANDHTVKFKSLSSTKFDSVATKIACPACAESNKITIPNHGYIGLTYNAKGDKNLAMRFIPGAIGLLYKLANQSGFAAMELVKQFGNFSATFLNGQAPVFPSGWFPTGFAPWFALQNRTKFSPLYGVLANSVRSAYNVTEMTALLNVMASPRLLGVSGNSTILQLCSVNKTIKDCGYLLYLKAYQARLSVGVPANDTLLLVLQQRIQELFCSSPSECLKLDQYTFKAIAVYITSHIAKLAIHIATDMHDFGPVMTRTVKQLSHGFKEANIKIPGLFPDGFSVRGFLPFENPSDASSKSSNEFYTCYSRTHAFQIRGLAGSGYVNEKYYPAADADFRKVVGYTSRFGFKSLTPCSKKQSAPKRKYTVFDTKLKLKFNILLKESQLVGPMYTHMYEADSKTMFAKNNVSVFTDGLIDISRISNGVPLVASMPHFLYANRTLIDLFKMNPNVTAHNTKYAIEPITGAPLKVQKRSQVNIAIPEITIQAPREKPFNITYMEKKESLHYSKIIPLFWIDVDIKASDALLSSLSGMYKGIEGGCVSMIVGPLFGGFGFILGMIYIVKSFKNQVHTHVEMD